MTTDPTPTMPAALEAVGISKSFGAVRALQDVTLRLQPGMVTAVLGENGAGKSTLIRICTGEATQDAGALRLGGEDVTFGNPLDAVHAGVQVVHQEPQLVDELSIAANLFLNELGERPPGGIVRRRDTVARARELLAEIGMADQLPRPERLCRDLSAAERQLVDIARALSRQPRVLFLDEPNSSLTRAETDRLFTTVRRLRDAGVAVALVSHRLAEVYEIAERIVVLRDGRLVAEGTPEEIDVDTAVARMAGAEKIAVQDQIGDPRPDRYRDTPVALEVVDCTGEGFRNVSFNVHAGEIVGMAGLVGAGRTATARGVVGMTPLWSGRVSVDGEPLRRPTPRRAQAMGLSYVAEERRVEVFHAQDVGFNLTARVLEQLGPVGTLSPRRRRRRSTSLMDDFGVKAESPRSAITSLSGGNQQKVLLARALATNPKVLVLNEPTRGVDVGTKAEVYALLRQLAREEGLAIWFISSELEEVVELADRVLVMRLGELVADEPNTGDAEQIVAASMGATSSTTAHRTTS